MSKKKKKSEKKPPSTTEVLQTTAAVDEVSAIYMQFRDMVLHEANTYLHDLDRARDITSEVFKRYLTFRPAVLKPGQWLRKVARNLSLNALRDTKKHDEKLHQIARAIGAVFRDSDALSAAAVDASRVYALAYSSDSPLGMVEQHVLQMIISEASTAEMAREIGLPESTMRDFKGRVLNSVRDLLQVGATNRRTL